MQYMNIKELLISGCEGFLGDENNSNQIDILFILREPNTGNKEKLDRFWFKDALEGNITGDTKAARTATLYKKVFGKIYTLLMNTKPDLKKCAYINLFPFCGGSTNSLQFRATRKALKRLEGQFDFESIEKYKENNNYTEEEYKKIAQNRLNIIRNLDCKYIVTTEDIFAAIAKTEKKTGDIQKGFFLDYREKIFNKFEIKKDIWVYSFYHPSARVNIDNLKNL